MKNSDLKSIKILLAIIALPIGFYMLKILSFIFIPLLFAMLIAILFLPLVRNLTRKNVPKSISLLVVILIIGLFIFLMKQLVDLSSQELLSSDNDVFSDIEAKLKETVLHLENMFGIERVNGTSIGEHYIQKIGLSGKLNAIVDSIGGLISMTVTTIFFTILLLAESLDFEKIINATIIKNRFSSIRVFRKIEKNVITFLKVKFWISLFTGIGFTIACYSFGVSLPIFWGLVAFLLNFIQMIGSIVSVIILSIFAMIEIDASGTLIFFILCISGVQVIFGSIMEPVFMGKTFSINVVTILIMLMFWGFIWGIPGLILSVPLTVILKILLEEFPKFKVITQLMSGD